MPDTIRLKPESVKSPPEIVAIRAPEHPLRTAVRTGQPDQIRALPCLIQCETIRHSPVSQIV